MIKNIPNFLYEMLLNQYGEELTNKIIQGYNANRVVTLRVNTLKTNLENIIGTLKENEIKFEQISWYSDALIIKNANESDIRKLKIYENGEIYLQSLSSMLPAIILNPSKDLSKSYILLTLLISFSIFSLAL